jgi:hypothetical protein
LPGSALRFRVLALAPHELRTKCTLGRVLIVRATTQPQVLGGRLATPRDWIHVVELQEAARRTAVPALAHERALALVPLPDRTLHVSGNVASTGVGCLVERGRAVAANLRFSPSRMSASSARSNRAAEIAAWNPVAQQRLGVVQLVVSGLIDRELDA